MKLGEKVYRAITYGFIVFIVGLIILTFGMPSFMGDSAKADRFLAAKVGDEVVTKKEVQNLKTNMLNMPQFQSFASNEDFLNRYALDYLVSEKLQINMQKNTGIYPLSDAKDVIVNRFLVKNFKEYQINNGIDYPRFKKEFMEPRRITDNDIISQVFRDSVYKNRQLFDKFESVSGYELADLHLLKNTKISYEILVFTPDEKKKVLKNLIGITEKDIVDKFNKDYLSKDKKDTLTDLKREAITQTLINEKRAKVEGEWMSALKNEAKSISLNQLSKKYGGIYISLNNISLTDSLSQAAKNGKANLQILENNPDFITHFKLDTTDKTPGTWNIEDNLFMLSVTNVIRPASEFSTNDSKKYEEEIKNQNKSNSNQLMDSILKRDIKVVKFSHGED
ncbi:MAG: SurA N-terminal domain-containing protein [Spirochaetia bacterium]|nr:SurA N-terminal domain-containing protein [Spirochaetia bacterium]